MTAPDPGLTDLIAAHWYNTSTCMCTCGWSTRHLPESDGDTRIGILVARHLALVVEQHGPNAAVAIADARRWEARAAKAEATIARVEKLQSDLFQRGGNLIAQWGAARLIRAALQEEFIRAALEGEQQ